MGNGKSTPSRADCYMAGLEFRQLESQALQVYLKSEYPKIARDAAGKMKSAVEVFSKRNPAFEKSLLKLQKKIDAVMKDKRDNIRSTTYRLYEEACVLMAVKGRKVCNNKL